jgi:ribosomal-protein-alanine N-acetyltransferase
LRLHEEEAHLLLLAVRGTEQRRGLGRRIVEWLETLARTAGISRIELEVRATSRGARAFYRALGYAELRIQRRYYSGVEDAIVMGRHLFARRRS